MLQDLHRIVFVCAIFLFAKVAGAQFSDSVHYYVSYAVSGIANKTKASESHVFNNAVQANINRKDLSLNSSFSWIYGKLNKVVSNDDYNIAVDFNYRKDSSRFDYWALANYDKSLSLQINHRLQYGAGASYNVIQTSRSRLNISNGILYENNNLRLADNVFDIYDTWRNSLRVKYSFNIANLIILDGVHFLQNSFSLKTDYIIKSSSSLSVKIYRWVSLTTSFTYNKLNRLKRENSILTVGLTFEKYF